MRAKLVTKNISTAYCFDLDETLIKTKARIHVYRNGAHFKSMTSKEYNFYAKSPNDVLDFSEFSNGDLILSAKKYIVWPVLQKVNKAILEDRSDSDIYILTGRSNIVKPYIYEFLKINGIRIRLDNILTIGDDKGKVNIAEEKRKKLKQLTWKYDEVIFFDDDTKNIELAKSIPGVKTKLVEAKYA